MNVSHPPTNDQPVSQCNLFERERCVSSTPRTLSPFADPVNHHLTTDKLAAELGLNPQSIRKRYSQTGSYFQLRPVKLPNRRLLWPADALEQLINHE